MKSPPIGIGQKPAGMSVAGGGMAAGWVSRMGRAGLTLEGAGQAAGGAAVSSATSAMKSALCCWARLAIHLG